MDKKENLANYLHDYLVRELEEGAQRSFQAMISEGIDAFEAGAFDGNEYEIVIDKVTRKV